MELLNSKSIWEIVLLTKHIVYQECMEENKRTTPFHFPSFRFFISKSHKCSMNSAKLERVNGYGQ